jgi:hypothetical protein
MTANDHLIAKLGRLARADRPHMSKPSRHRQHIGTHPLDIGNVAASHHGKRAFLGALGAARDWRINPPHPVGGLQSCGDGACCIWMD